MYLQRLYFENNGPLRRLAIEAAFTDDGHPKPIVLVGSNGSGKTTLLSTVADALFEAASAHYQDVVPHSMPGIRPWFRIVGSTTISVGAAGGCSLIEFLHNGQSYFYREKGGHLAVEDVASRVPKGLEPAIRWDFDESSKSFSIPDKEAGDIFESGAYVYFPSSRAEIPHWLNRETLKTEDFDLSDRFAKRLRKPIYVERSLEQIKQWLLGLIVDIRMDFNLVLKPETGELEVQPLGDAMAALAHRHIWNRANDIVKIILDDQEFALGWGGRNAPFRLVLHRKGEIVAPTIDALSAGQTTLLSIFATLLRYGDAVPRFPAPPVLGVCLIDEIDAHMHVDLQSRALPRLMKMFPQIQFIVSSHSPLFVLGMEREFGPDGLSIFDMPSGTSIRAETYREFGRALDVFKETVAFNAAIEAAASQPGKLLVLVEGETDPEYLQAAADLLGRSDLLEKVEFSWVGAKDPNSGQGFHTGKDALNKTLLVLRAKPNLVQRPILLLYDNDTNKDDEDFGRLHTRRMPASAANSIIEAGIENLLPESAITPDMFDEKFSRAKNGSKITQLTLNKMRLCKRVCVEERNGSNFSAFASVLDLVSSVLRLHENSNASRG